LPGPPAAAARHSAAPCARAAGSRPGRQSRPGAASRGLRRLAEHGDAPLQRLQEVGDDPQQGRLPAAGRPEDGQEIAFGDLEVEACQVGAALPSACR
jgi:hypothetical protein